MEVRKQLTRSIVFILVLLVATQLIHLLGALYFAQYYMVSVPSFAQRAYLQTVIRENEKIRFTLNSNSPTPASLEPAFKNIAGAIRHFIESDSTEPCPTCGFVPSFLQAPDKSHPHLGRELALGGGLLAKVANAYRLAPTSDNKNHLISANNELEKNATNTLVRIAIYDGEYMLADGLFAPRYHEYFLFFVRGMPIAALLFLVASGFALYFAVKAARFLTNAASELQHGAEVFAGGNLHHRIRVTAVKEFTQVGECFNNMASGLALAHEELAERNTQLQRQQEVSESLLLNILPESVAAELKEKGAVDPRYHEDVTILFTDFQGFTLSTEKLAAEELVLALHNYFTAFDKVVQRYGLEKLKTIGDSYMCVAGLPERRSSHAVDAVMAAFEIVETVRQAHSNGLLPWSIRVGVHTGQVVSGVVGIRKFAFDIWGESVNFASRMESSGSPNKVNLSSSTFSRVKDFFECEHRGKVKTKEGREFDMYFAVGLLPSLSEEMFATRYKKYFQQEPPSLPASLIGETKHIAGSSSA